MEETLRSPITGDECVECKTFSSVPKSAEKDEYDSNEYFSTFLDGDTKIYVKHKGNAIRSTWTKK